MSAVGRALVYKPRARKPLLRMPRPQALALRQALESVATGEMGSTDIKPLRGHRGFFRVRLGSVRAVVEIANEVVTVWLIGERGQVYKDLAAMRLD
ncbi:MAG: hypothetical protein SFV19_01500 [Rhodospirillaceae bacterium]|nr:hypothetical protein [Rhodospirillaceae bacterium]